LGWTSLGDPVHGEVISTDAHLGVAAILYPAGAQVIAGVVQPRTQLATEFAVVTDIELLMPAGGNYEILFYPLGGAITSTAGTRIVKGNSSVSGGVAHHFDTPRTGPKGYGVAVIADAGQALDVVITGGLCKV
jgi:hypothetical protein